MACDRILKIIDIEALAITCTFERHSLMVCLFPAVHIPGQPVLQLELHTASFPVRDTFRIAYKSRQPVAGNFCMQVSSRVTI